MKIYWWGLLMVLAVQVRAQQLYSSGVLERKVDSVLQLMTLEEKIGQLTLYTSDWAVTGPTMRDTYKEDIRKGRCGNIFNAHTAAYNRTLQKIAVEETRMKIPLLFGYDVVHGYKTIFPIPLAESCSWDLEAMKKAASVAGVEASAAGLHWTYAPMVDIARDPRWGRITEGAGEDTYLGSKIAMARVQGFQGNQLSANNTVAACVKHYAAYGAAQAGRDYHTTDMSDATLRDVYLPPFKAALVDASAASVMNSFNELNGVPATANTYLLKDILRDEWGWKGMVVTDYTSINEMVPHGFAADLKDAARLAINAGVDMDMQGSAYADHLGALVKEGKVSTVTINERVKSVLRLKFQLGLFDDPYRYSDEAREQKAMYAPEHLAAALDISRKSIVLLKNEKRVLPLKKNIRRIALIGPLGDSQVDMLGSWHGAGDASKVVTVLSGLKKKLGNGVTIDVVKGCDVTGDNTSGFAAAIAAAKKAEVVLLAIGENEPMAGEARSRSNIHIPGVQVALAKELSKLGVPVVVLLHNGRPLVLSDLEPFSSTILECWMLGTMHGEAVADVLFGDFNPSGKLTTTFPRSEGQIPLFYNMKNTGRPYDPNNGYTSRYLDIPNTPLYPFGYGLSYTQFQFSQPKVNTAVWRMGQTLEISTTVTNTGSQDGTTVAQLYIRDLVGMSGRPVRELKGFERVTLRKGESKTVVFRLTAADVSYTHPDGTFGADPGAFELYVGEDANAVNMVKVDLTH